MADGAEVGPYCVLRGPVKLGSGVRLLPNVQLMGPIEIGAGTVVYPFACLGFPAQDFKFTPGSATAGAVIGEGCILREHCSVHAATNDHTPTRVGDGVFMMGSTHVAHDCRIGDRVVMVNGSGIAGHTVVGDDVNFGGNAVVHQHCRIGRMVMMSGDCAVSLDVPPFCMVSERNRIGGLNLVGLRRAGVDREQIAGLRKAFGELLREPMPRGELVRELHERGKGNALIAEMALFIEQSERGITPGLGRGVRGSRGDVQGDGGGGGG